jgi:hypothetical protein
VDFLKKEPSSVPILLDSKGKIGRLLGLWAHPTTYLVNRKGMVIYRAVGMVDWTGIAATSVLEKLLSEI